MERLTGRELNNLGSVYYSKCHQEDCHGNCGDCEITREIELKLKHYEDLEEQGLLLRLPCKVGDRFWELNTANGIPYIYPRMAHSLSLCVNVLERLGKTTFLTKEEAEEALARMVKENEWN